MPIQLDTATVRRVRRASTFGLVGAAALAYAASATLRDAVDHAAVMLAQGDVGALRDYLLSFGVWAPVVSALLMVLQSISAPLPAFLLAFANGLAFGAFWGGLLMFASALLAAALSFGIARVPGRELVEALVGTTGLAAADAWFARRGAWAILVARLVPIVSFDSISYAAGLTAMRFRGFIAATALGIIPATFIYAYLGERAPQTIIVLFGVFAVVVVAGVAVGRLRDRKKDSQ